MKNVIRWSRPGTTAWTTVHVWRGSKYSLDENTQGSVIGTVSIFSGSQFIGTLVDTTGSINDFYAVRYYDGQYFTTWSPKLLGNAAGPSYCTIRDLYDYYEKLDDILHIKQGTNDVGSMYDVVSRFMAKTKTEIDNSLRTVYPVPIMPNEFGKYDDALVEINACMTLWKLVDSRLVDTFESKPEFLQIFESRAIGRLAGLLSKDEPLSSVHSYTELGVGPAVQSANNKGLAKMYTDKTTYFTGKTAFTMTVVAESSGAVGSATFKVSYDNKRTYAMTGITIQDFQNGFRTSLGYDVYVWLEKSLDTGAFDIVSGDEWTIQCIPMNDPSVGRGIEMGEIILG